VSQEFSQKLGAHVKTQDIDHRLSWWYQLFHPTTMFLIFSERLSGKQISHSTCRNTAGGAGIWEYASNYLPAIGTVSHTSFTFTKIAICILR